MKKLLGIIFLYLFMSVNAFAIAMNKYTISCEGVVDIKKFLRSQTLNEQENFYEDYEISTTVDNKVVLGVEIINSSHNLLRRGFYMEGDSEFGKLGISSDKSIFILDEDDNSQVYSDRKSTTSSIKTRLSIINSSSIGSFVHTIEFSDWTGRGFYNYRTKCSGAKDLYKVLKQVN